MLLAYSPDPDFQRHLRCAVGRTITLAPSWSQLERCMRDASCLIAHFQPLDSELGDRFALLKARFVHVPVVAIVERVPEVAVFFRGVVIDEVVWVHRIYQQLSGAISQALNRSFQHRVSAAVRNAPHLTPLTVQFITAALNRDRPYRTVQRVAHELRVDTKTIHNHWRASGMSASELSPKDFIDWMLLLRSAAMRSAGNSWSEIGSALAAHPRTLHRLGNRLLHDGLSGTEGARAVNAAFCRTVLPLLLRSAFPNFDGISAFCHYTAQLSAS